MARKKIEDLSTQELKNREKTLRSLLYLALSIIVIYIVAMSYLISNGSWSSKNSLYIVPIAICIIVLALNTVRNAVTNELRKRNNP